MRSCHWDVVLWSWQSCNLLSCLMPIVSWVFYFAIALVVQRRQQMWKPAWQIEVSSATRELCRLVQAHLNSRREPTSNFACTNNLWHGSSEDFDRLQVHLYSCTETFSTENVALSARTSYFYSRDLLLCSLVVSGTRHVEKEALVQCMATYGSAEWTWDWKPGEIWRSW